MLYSFIDRGLKMKEENNYGMLLRQINIALEKRCNNRLKEADLTFSQMSALIEIADTPTKKLTFKELEKRMTLAQSTTAGLISRLEQKKLVIVTGDENDKRIKYVEISSLGEEYYNNARQEMQQTENELVKNFSSNEKELFLYFLKKVNSNLKEP